MTLRTICLTTSSPFHCCTFYSLQQWKDLFLMMLPANTDRQHHTDRDHQPKVTGQNIVCRRQPTPHQTVDYIQSNMAVFDQSATRHQDRQPQPELSSDKKLSDTRHTRNNVCHNLEISSLTQFTNPHGINVRLCGEKRPEGAKITFIMVPTQTQNDSHRLLTVARNGAAATRQENALAQAIKPTTVDTEPIEGSSLIRTLIVYSIHPSSTAAHLKRASPVPALGSGLHPKNPTPPSNISD